MLVAAKSAIQDAPAAAELTTDERVSRVRSAVLCGFAMMSLCLEDAGKRQFVSKELLSSIRAKPIWLSTIPNLDT